MRRIAVIGQLATAENIGDRGSSRVRPPSVVTPLEGIEAATRGRAGLMVADGHSLQPAAEAARHADVAIVVAGYNHRDEGEKLPAIVGGSGGDRKRLRLSPEDERLILVVAEANPRTVVVLIGGAAIIMEAWKDRAAAIVMAWYAGMEGGHALADILFGRINPSAKLPCVFPASEEQLPPFSSAVEQVEYGYVHGYRLLERNKQAPAFPFGFGLSYTTFAYGDLRLDQAEMAPDSVLGANIDVTNSGSLPGNEIVQLYIGYEDSQVERSPKDLKGFANVSLQPGETKTVRFAVPVPSLAYYDKAQKRWIVEPISYRLFVGGSSANGDLLETGFRVTAR